MQNNKKNATNANLQYFKLNFPQKLHLTIYFHYYKRFESVINYIVYIGKDYKRFNVLIGISDYYCI